MVVLAFFFFLRFPSLRQQKSRKARVPEESTSYATMLAGGCYRPPDVMVTHNWSNKYLHLVAAIFSEVWILFLLPKKSWPKKKKAHKIRGHILGDIYQAPPKKTYVFYKNTAIYSVSRTFWPLDFGSFFGGHHMYNINKVHNM